MNSSQNPSALRSKKIITETLLRLMEQYPYSEITVKLILLESTVSRKTFYRNFSSKDDVLNSYIDAILLSYLDTLKENEEYSFFADTGCNILFLSGKQENTASFSG